jgi:uncharacterized integral membrane protein (TIGR02327 family)
MNFSAILELAMFFVFLIFVFQNLQSIDYSKIFKKGKTGQIQIVFMMVCIIVAYLLTKALMNIIELSQVII